MKDYVALDEARYQREMEYEERAEARLSAEIKETLEQSFLDMIDFAAHMHCVSPERVRKEFREWYEEDGRKPRFATCPDAKKWRRKE